MDQTTSPLIFLKLGGSLITDKQTPSTALLPRIERLADEISRIRAERPGMKLLLGHGSGSFGHVAASKYGTRQGVDSPEEWRGFVDVWRQASVLNRIMVEALHQAGLPAVVFSAASSAIVDDGMIMEWDLSPVVQALDHGLLPVVHGDVAFDRHRGGTILSTEDIFDYFALALQPSRILLAGIETGVWADYPACTEIAAEITPENQDAVLGFVRGSAATDVTGGMASKVQQMLRLTGEIPGLEVEIFSALAPGDLHKAFAGSRTGTLIHSPKVA